MKRDEKQPKRLLCIVGGMDAGGAETFLMKVYRALNKSKYQMDFYVTSQEEGFYDKEITLMGGKIYHSIPKSKGLIKSFNILRNIVKIEKYDCVMRVSQHSLSALDLFAAKVGGAKTLVYRSSNTRTGGNRFNRILHVLLKWLAMSIPTIKIAPSTEAAEFMFGKNCVKKGNATIVKNAISVDNYIFNKEKREKIRKEFTVEDKFVIGHVGRFHHQKNHSFLIDIFFEICKENSNSVLILVGKGELGDEITDKIKAFGLADKVIFTGVRSDVPYIMMAMDVFIFPSFYEGMPNTVIEAQVTGLPCIISDTITKEVKITDLVTFISLNDTPVQWAKLALTYERDLTRKDVKKDFVYNGYDIETVIKQFEKIVFNH